MYVIRAKRRDELINYLKDNGIETAIHYPTPLPMLEAYQYLNYKASDFPIANQYKNEILSLPLYPEITSEQINYIASIIKSFYQK